MDTSVKCDLTCVCVFTCVCFVQVALQATHIRRFKGAEFAPEGLVVPVVRLHMSVQTGDDKEHTHKKKKKKEGYEIRGKYMYPPQKKNKDQLRAKGRQIKRATRRRALLYNIHFHDSNSGVFHQHLKRSILFTSQTTAAHFQ